MAFALFVSGTDTDVGKTVFSAVLCRALADRGYAVAYYKPVQSGALPIGDRLLADGSETERGIDSEASVELVSPDVALVQRLAPAVTTRCTYTLALPAAPQLAAEVSQPPVVIDRDRLDTEFQALNRTHDIVIVEGAGGLAVPLSPQLAIVDVPVAWHLPLILVSRPDLGTINHTCLSLAYARQRSLEVLGVVFNYRQADLDPRDPILATAPRFVQQLCGPLSCCQLPYIDLDLATQSDSQILLDWSAIAQALTPVLTAIGDRCPVAGIESSDAL